MRFPIGIYTFKVDNKSNKIRCETCFKLKDKYTTTTLPDDVLLFLLLSYFQLNHVYIVDRRCWRRLWKHELNLTSTYWCCSCSQKFCLIRWKTPVLESLFIKRDSNKSVVNIAKFLGTTVSQNTSERLLMRVEGLRTSNFKPNLSELFRHSFWGGGKITSHA